MPDIVTQIAWLLVVVGPFAGYFIVLHRQDQTRLRLILAAVMGAAGPAMLWGAAGALTDPSSAWDLLPYVVAAAMYGATIGIFGILARLLGAWLTRRQP